MIDRVSFIYQKRAYSAKAKWMDDRYDKYKHNCITTLIELQTTLRNSKNIQKYIDPLIKKVMPKYTNYEKEQLLQKNLQLNKEIYMVNQRIKKVQTENRRIKYDNMAKQLKKVSNQNIGFSEPKHLLDTIKRQYLVLKRQYQELQQQNQALKRQGKYLKSQQLLIELKLYEQESKRLYEMVVKLGGFGQQQKQRLKRRQNKQMKVRYKQQNEFIEQLHQEIQKKYQEIDSFKIQKHMYENKEINLNSKIRNLLDQNNGLRKIIQEQQTNNKIAFEEYQKQLSQKDQIENYRFQTQKKYFETKIQQKDADIQQLQKKIIHYAQMLKHYKVQLIPFEISEQGHKQSTSNDIKSCKEQQKSSIRPRHISLQNKPTKAPLYKNQSDVMESKESQSSHKGSKKDIQIKNKQQLTIIEQKAKLKRIDNRRCRVELSGINTGVQLLKVNLNINEISFESMTSFLEQQNRQQISILQLSTILKTYPFNLKNQQQNFLMCRYLIEDEKQQYIFYDENKTKNIEIVKSIFRKIIGKYEIRDEKKQKLMLGQAKKFIDFYYQSIKQYFKIIGKDFKKQKCVDHQQFQKIIIEGGLSKDKQLMRFLIQLMVKESGSITKMNIQSLHQFADNYQQFELAFSQSYQQEL